jgi:hypothetical protein
LITRGVVDEKTTARCGRFFLNASSPGVRDPQAAIGVSFDSRAR